MVYRNVSKRDIILYDTFSNKKMIKIGEEVESDRFPGVVGHLAFLNIGKIPTPKRVVIDEKDELLKALAFQKENFFSLEQRVSKLESSLTSVKSEMLKLQPEKSESTQEDFAITPAAENIDNTKDSFVFTERALKKNVKK